MKANMRVHKSKLAATVFFFCLSAGGSFAQLASTDKLCSLKLNPAVSNMVLSWDNFNMFGNSQSKTIEKDFIQEGEGDSCKIKSVDGNGKNLNRPCSWHVRLSCDLILGQDAATHKFSVGSFQYGKLQWTGNEKLELSVKRKEVIQTETRDVAVVNFKGTWSNGGGRGDSEYKVFYDREWGVMLKIIGAHDANKWGNTVSQLEFK